MWKAASGFPITSPESEMVAAGIARDGPRRLQAAWLVLSEAYLAPIAAICLSSSPRVGLGLWLVLLQQPQLALAGVVALGALELLSQWSRLRSGGPLFDLTDRANGLLSALAGTWIFLPAGYATSLVVVMIAGTALAGLVFTFLAKDLVMKSGLPAIVWPYCVIAFLVFTIFPESSMRSLAYFHWPLFHVGGAGDLPETFLRSMGVFLFSPWPLSGILITAFLLAWSPAMVLAGIAGWLSGVAVSSALSAAGAPIFWAAASYNFFLSGAALGAVFFVPDLRGLLQAAIGGALAALVAASMQVLTEYSAVSFLPIPFAISLYCGLVLFSARPFGRPQDRIASWNGRPEENRLSRDWMRCRWGAPGTPLLGVPLQGVVEITQGFDDELSHRGDWRHALDFQRPVPPGDEPADRPSLWAEPVFSPVNGRVVGFAGTVPDNPLGAANFAENWGNHVILETTEGVRVLLGHLMQNSVSVTPGQSVGFSTRLGLVGNSGRSAVPHLHLQAQTGDQAGAPTRDFRLANYFACAGDTHLIKRWHASGQAARGDIVMAAAPNPGVHGLLSGILPGRGIWTVSSENGTPPEGRAHGPLVLETGLLENGHYKVRQGETAWMSLALDFDGLRLTGLEAPSDSLLSHLATALATIPFAAFPGLTWDDWLPRASARLHARYFEKFISVRNTRLCRVQLRCDALEEAGTPALVVTATSESGIRDRGATCQLTFMPQRGPVRLVLDHEAGRRTFTQISFEPRER